MRITRAQANKLAKKAKPAKPQVVAPIPQEKPKAPSAYKFKVDRDEHGRMTSVSAHLADDEEIKFDVKRTEDGELDKITAKPIEVKNA